MKPTSINWWDYLIIQSAKIRYQPLLFPQGETISQKCGSDILSSFDKLQSLRIADKLPGKTVLDIGCAEGFFVLEAARRGAKRAVGCDMTKSRIRIAKILAGAWDFLDKTEFMNCDLYSIPSRYESQVVFCLAVAHHLHGGNHDTWKMVSQPSSDPIAFKNMLKAVKRVADLTQEVTCWEYSYEYETSKPRDVDYQLLGKCWEQEHIYSKVDFMGLSQELPKKDRAIYHAYK